MTTEIVVIGCGMITPVGLSARETAASTRSRTARLTSIEWRDSRFHRFTVGIVPDDGLPPLQSELDKLALTPREFRMLRLAEPAIQEALRRLPQSIRSVPLLIGLPELHTTVPIKDSEFLAHLAAQTAANIDLANSFAISQGRASGLLAVKGACERLGQGKAAYVLAGGVDTYVDLYILGTLDSQKRVRTEINPDGFAPGEGAGFLLLTTADQARRQGLQTLAKVVGTSAAIEDGHVYSDKPYRGEGLASAFESLFAASPGCLQVGCVYASFNGEHYWAKEFSVAVLRQREHFANPHQVEHPAECFGDLGAAHGPVMVGLAASGIKRNPPNTNTIVFSSSDLGTGLRSCWPRVANASTRNMPSTVHNIQGFAHKGSGGMSTVFPDVCKTPTPAGPVPLPYPNIGKAADTSQGTSTVKADGEMIMVKGAKYIMSAGDEAGSVGGVISGVFKGECEFLMYSFDVMLEGKNVCRLADPLWHNKKNIAG